MMSAVTALCSYLDPNNVEGVIASWKMSNEDANHLRWMMVHKDYQYSIDNLYELIVNGVPRHWVTDWMIFNDYRSSDVQMISDWEAPVFPVNGNDLIALGITPGPQIGQILKLMKSDWVASKFKDTREELLAYINMYKGYANG